MKHPFNCFTIGLTGGIASGKSAVSQFFESLNCQVIDTDIIAREVVEPESYGLNQLVNLFGNSILTENGQLDRLKLRKIVFDDSKKLSVLNSTLHPLIQQNVFKQVEAVKQKYCIIVIPLLCESSSFDWLDRKLVVDVMPKTQIDRLIKRDSISKNLANKMLNSQCNREQRLNIADDVINNEQSLDDLQKHVESLNCLYKTLIPTLRYL